MVDVLLIALLAVTVQNLTLTHLLGIEPATTGRDPRAAASLGLQVTGALVVLTLLSVLAQRAGIEALDLAALRLVLLAMLLAVALFWLPRLTEVGVAGLVLGALSGAPIDQRLTALAELARAAGAGLGYTLVAAVFASLHDRLRHPAVPAALRQGALGFVTAGILSLTLIGYAGLGPFRG
jgi:electron transport complex protein RnfA